LSERAEKKDKLRRKEEIFRVNFQTNPDAIIINNLRTGGCVEINKSFTRLTGYSKKDIIGKESVRMFWSIKRDYLFFLRKINQKGYINNYSTMFNIKGGGTVTALMSSKIIRIGNARHVISVLKDITDLKNAEDALRESEERYRTLFENNPIETLIVDHMGRVTGYNLAKARSGMRLPNIGDVMYKDYASHHCNDMYAELMDCIKTGIQKEFPEQAYESRVLNIRFSPFTGGAIITNIDITESKRASEQIQDLSRQLLLIQEEERQRIARDLHDSVAQDLSSLRIKCETFFDTKGISSEAMNLAMVKQKINGISAVLKNSIQALRCIAYELRPPGLDELGLPITLYRYCEDFSEATQIEIDFFSAGLENLQLNPDVEINTYRIVQEALNNIKKHSGATKVLMRLVASYPVIILRIDDNGKGFDQTVQALQKKQLNHMGLSSMEERIRLLGGSISITSSPGSGTNLVARIPVKEE
jgi:PAS domain S-box-containing protein